MQAGIEKTAPANGPTNGHVLWFKHLVEYLEGARDGAPPGFPLKLASPLWGFWWAILLGFIIVFSGQSSKFIYIDF